MKTERLYQTGTMLERTLRVAYPAGRGRVVLRTEMDWERDVEPDVLSDDGDTSTFTVRADQPFVYFKACLVTAHERYWSVGANKLLLMTEDDQRVCYPYFLDGERGRFSPLVEFPSAILGRGHRLRVHVPPGYHENTLATYPVAFMQDGQNLFFPDEAFMGRDWDVGETSQTLRAMSAVEDFVIVGIHSDDRMREYTLPGYEPYARSLAEEIVPEAERRLRIGTTRRHRSVWVEELSVELGLPLLAKFRAQYERAGDAPEQPQAPAPARSNAKAAPEREHAPAPAPAAQASTGGSAPGLMQAAPVRSGQQVYAENSDLTVLTAVGAGAEVIADGSIHIYGALRGRALAGAQGNEKARIFCREFHAELVAVAGHYKVLEDIPKDLRGKAVQVYLEHGELRIAALD